MALSVKRFKRWSPSHQERYLKEIGSNRDKFYSRKPKKQRSALRRARSAQRRLDQPSQVTQALTPRRLRRETKAATDLEFGPAEEQLDKERRISKASEARVPNWYDDYEAKIAANNATSKKAYGDAQTKLASLDTSAGEGNAASLKAANATFGGLLATQSAAATTRGATRSSTAGGQRVSELLAERKRRHGIESKGRKLSKEKGQFSTTYRGKMREGERDYQDKLRTQRLGREALNLDKTKADTDAEANEAAANLSADKFALDLREQTETERHNRASEGSKGSKGSKPTAGQTKRKNQRASATDWFLSHARSKSDVDKFLNRAKGRQGRSDPAYSSLKDIPNDLLTRAAVLAKRRLKKKKKKKRKKR